MQLPYSKKIDMIVMRLIKGSQLASYKVSFIYIYVTGSFLKIVFLIFNLCIIVDETLSLTEEVDILWKKFIENAAQLDEALLRLFGIG